MSRIDEINNITIQLSTLLEKCRFRDELQATITQLKNQLDNNQISAEDYCNHHHIVDALNELNIGKQYLLPVLFRIWREQAHSFSAYEKIFLTLSALVLMAAAFLSHEFIVILLDGKPKLKASASAIMDYCTMGLSDRIISVCGNLTDGQTAVFDMNRRTAELPTFLGSVDDPIHGPVPATALQSIASWINPLSWINFFTCTHQNNVTNFIGHFCIDAVTAAASTAKNGFPVLMQTALQYSDDATTAMMFNATAQAFLAFFCIKIQNGGYSEILKLNNQPYGHFNGFQHAAEDFEKDTYLFAGVYGGITALAFLATTILLMTKVISKWTHSEPKREQLQIARQAHALFKQFKASELSAHAADSYLLQNAV